MLRHFAYLDPGTGSLILQAVIGAMLGIIVFFRSFFIKIFIKIKSIFVHKKSDSKQKD